MELRVLGKFGLEELGLHLQVVRAQTSPVRGSSHWVHCLHRRQSGVGGVLEEASLGSDVLHCRSHCLRSLVRLLEVDGCGVLNVVFLGCQLWSLDNPSEVLWAELLFVLGDVPAVRVQVVASGQLLVQTLGSTSGIRLGKHILGVDTRDEASVAGNPLVSNHVLGPANPAQSVPRVVSHTHLLLVSVELVEHALLASGPDRRS